MKKFFKIKNKFIKEYHELYLSLRFFVWFIFVNEFLFEFKLLEGESMLPTFNPYGEIVILEKFYFKYSRYKLKKDDIICSLNPMELNTSMCKRIIKTEGDKIYNDEENNEKIQKNHLWIEGDNKDNSLDSRKFGPIHKELIKGRVIMKVWPNIEFFGI